MAKYDPLRVHLDSGSQPVEMSLADVGRLVGGLPPTAYRRPAWWSNNTNHHVQAKAWTFSGRGVISIDLLGQRVIFSAPEIERRPGRPIDNKRTEAPKRLARRNVRPDEG